LQELLVGRRLHQERTLLASLLRSRALWPASPG
jgi:hypothetical protein